MFRKAHLLGIVSICVFICIPALAQIRVEKVSLPFAFNVGDDKFEAGTYSFSQETRNDQMLIQGGKKGRMLIRTSPLVPEGLATPEHTTLVFHKNGSTYFLNQIWSKRIGFQMPLSAEEKKLVADGQQVSEVKVNVKTH